MCIYFKNYFKMMHMRAVIVICSNKCNVGYGFVNMTSPEATWRLYKAFHLQPWEVFNSRKICEVTYARVQVPDDHGFLFCFVLFCFMGFF